MIKALFQIIGFLLYLPFFIVKTFFVELGDSLADGPSSSYWDAQHKENMQALEFDRFSQMFNDRQEGSRKIY